MVGGGPTSLLGVSTMADLSILTFNVENLFRRFQFSDDSEDPEYKKYLSVYGAWEDSDREILAKSYYNAVHDEIRTFTALSIAAADPDVVCLQEVDSMPALKYFHDRYLSRVGKMRK